MANKSALPTGSQTDLRCEASGDGPLTLHWKKADRIIESDQRIEVTSTWSAASSGDEKRYLLGLNISRVAPQDGGWYSCEAANAFGSDAAQFQLVVQGCHLVTNLCIFFLRNPSASLRILWNPLESSLPYNISPEIRRDRWDRWARIVENVGKSREIFKCRKMIFGFEEQNEFRIFPKNLKESLIQWNTFL